MWERIRALIVKEFIQVFRDPKLRAIVLAVPILQALVFGYAVTTDVRQIAMTVLDLDSSQKSRELIQAFIQSGYFSLVQTLHDEGEINQAMDGGTTLALLRIQPGFAEDLAAGRSAQVQILIDGSDANTANIVLEYVNRLIHQKSQQIFVARLQKMGERSSIPSLNLESRTWFNENLESRNYYVPGLIATILTLMTLTLTSMAIVREKEIGTMEQILVTPIKKYEFILGKTIPFIAIGFVGVGGILLIALFWFQVPFRGSFFLLFLAIVAYLMTTLGIGFFISTISQTQQQAMMSAFLFYFPAILLSGFIFPIAHMPLPIQWLTYFNPLSYFLIIIRGIFLKGVGLGILWPQMAALTCMGFITISLAIGRFKKTLN